MDSNRAEVENHVTASVIGTVVQAGYVSGGFHVHAAAPSTPPRQLPASPTCFTGRATDLAALDEALDRSTGHAVVVIVGSGGMGKTALALKWLGDRADRFVDGQLYADLSAFGAQGPAEPGRVLGRRLRGLGVPAAEVPPELDERSALFRSVTAGRSIALLLDDAASTAQAQMLLPGSGNNIVSCYAGADYSAGFKGSGGADCVTGASFLHPLNAHRPRTMQFGLKFSF